MSRGGSRSTRRHRAHYQSGHREDGERDPRETPAERDREPSSVLPAGRDQSHGSVTDPHTCQRAEGAQPSFR